MLVSTMSGYFRMHTLRVPNRSWRSTGKGRLNQRHRLLRELATDPKPVEPVVSVEELISRGMKAYNASDVRVPGNQDLPDGASRSWATTRLPFKLIVTAVREPIPRSRRNL